MLCSLQIETVVEPNAERKTQIENRGKTKTQSTKNEKSRDVNGLKYNP